MKRYAIVNKKHIIPTSNTTKSRYSVNFVSDTVPTKRKLVSREAARQFKRSLNGNWAIVDMQTREVVR